VVQETIVAEPAEDGNDVEAELVRGQGEMRLGLGSEGLVEARAVGVWATANTQGQAQDGVQSGDSADGPAKFASLEKKTPAVRLRRRRRTGVAV
jgi:hypothetical protein